MELIGTKIQTLRRNKNMTQAQLAEVLSVSSQSVSKWENNLSVPDISLLPVIARYFGITMDELFNYRLDALNYKERFIRFLADNGALQFGEFLLQSGRLSPYFINTGSYKSASQISRLGEFYAECLRENNVETNLLMGNTQNEIPIMIAARSGRTLKASLQALYESTGQTVSHVIVSVDRMERGAGLSQSARQEIEKAYGIKIHAIVTLNDIIRAVENGIVGGSQHIDTLKRYQEKYGEN